VNSSLHAAKRILGTIALIAASAYIMGTIYLHGCRWLWGCYRGHVEKSVSTQIRIGMSAAAVTQRIGHPECVVKSDEDFRNRYRCMLNPLPTTRIQ
jgi:hypothetical protein